MFAAAVIRSFALPTVSALLALCAVAGCRPAPQPATLACTYLYGGESKSFPVAPTSDPYRVPALEIGESFAFKAVYVTAPEDVAALALYAYHRSEQGPVLLEEVKYRPPYPQASAGARYGFTGLHFVYAPGGSELEYWCAWNPR